MSHQTQPLALVTGGGSGIGRGIALALARRGMALALAGRRADRLAAVAAEIQAAGGSASCLQADLTDPGQIADLAERAAALGLLRVLVNCAGALAGGPFAERSPAEIEQAVALNLLAPLLLTRRLLPELRARGGAVVLVGSMLSFVPLPGAALYAATKHGLRAFGAALRCELAGTGVRLLTAHPPGTATALTAGMRRRAPALYRPARPEQVGERIVLALEQGREELAWGAGERLLIGMERLAPTLAARLIRRFRGPIMDLFAAG
ncbi:MAG TPA: SDR family NAD(P)-dependent oxidoreductase [Herpetosiphonaceae bacterium]